MSRCIRLAALVTFIHSVTIMVSVLIHQTDQTHPKTTYQVGLIPNPSTCPCHPVLTWLLHGDLRFGQCQVPQRTAISMDLGMALRLFGQGAGHPKLCVEQTLLIAGRFHPLI